MSREATGAIGDALSASSRQTHASTADSKPAVAPELDVGDPARTRLRMYCDLERDAELEMDALCWRLDLSESR